MELSVVKNLVRSTVRPDRPSPSTALRYWSSWLLDRSPRYAGPATVEERYASDPERYGWPGDVKVANRERYDILTAEAVEDIVRMMPVQERDLLRLIYIKHPAMAPDHMARRMGMSQARFELLEIAARARFARIWKGEADAKAA